MTQTSDLRSRAHGTDVATKKGDARAEANAAVRAMETSFQAAMPRGTDAAQLVRDAMTLFSANPNLAVCDRRSVLGGLMTCAQLGLRPGVLGQAWLIPFKGKATLIIGYQGLVTLAQRSGDIASISARIIHENDEWDVEFGTEARLVHRPFMRGDRGPAVAYYAVVKSTRGGTYWEVMTKADAEEHRDRFAMQRCSESAKKDWLTYIQSTRGDWISGPWVDCFDAMALKTVLIRTLKLAPRNTEVQKAFDVDNTVRVDVNPHANAADVTVPAAALEASPAADSGDYDPTTETGWTAGGETA